jgi:hypothetical protein
MNGELSVWVQYYFMRWEQRILCVYSDPFEFEERESDVRKRALSNMMSTLPEGAILCGQSICVEQKNLGMY